MGKKLLPSVIRPFLIPRNVEKALNKTENIKNIRLSKDCSLARRPKAILRRGAESGTLG